MIQGVKEKVHSFRRRFFQTLKIVRLILWYGGGTCYIVTHYILTNWRVPRCCGEFPLHRVKLWSCCELCRYNCDDGWCNQAGVHPQTEHGQYLHLWYVSENTKLVAIMIAIKWEGLQSFKCKWPCLNVISKSYFASIVVFDTIKE